MSIISIILICLCIGVEAFWTGFYLKCRHLSFSIFTILLAYLGSLLICVPFLYFGKFLGETSDPRLLNAIAGLIFGILGALSLTQNIKRKENCYLKWILKYHAYDKKNDCCIKSAHAFFTGMISSFSALLACVALGILNICTPFICVILSMALIQSLILGIHTSRKTALMISESITKYLPGCILLFIGLLKFF